VGFLLYIYFSEIMNIIKDTRKKTKKSSQENPERKREEVALRESEDKFRSIFENASDCIIFLDKSGRILEINRKAEEMFGGSKEELFGKHFTKVGVISPRDIPVVISAFAKALIGQKTTSTICIKNKKGREICVEVSGSLLKRDSKLAGLLVIARDVTERKKTEEALKEAERKFRNMVEITSDWIWEVDKNGVYTYASPKIKEILGYEPKEVIGKTPFDLMPKDEAKKIAKIFGEIAKDKKVFHDLENWNIHKNGRKVLLETSGVPILDEKGNLIGYRGMDRDITERKKMEEALREERNKLQKYLAVAGIIVLVLSPEGKVLLMNNKGSEVLGYKRMEILGKNWFTNFIPEKNRAEVRAFFEKLINEIVDHVEYFENIVLTKNGEKKTISWHNSLLKDEKGGVQAILSTGADITELKQAKMTIEQLKELDKMKDEFLNIAAHELRTPLTSIIGLSEIIKEQNPSLASSSQKYIDIINAEGVKLSHIIKRMLTVTRFESGRETVYLEQFNLPAFVSSSLPNLNIIAKEKKSRIVFETEKKSIVIRSDKEKISQVIYNFVDNAVKYGPEGQTITISVIKPERDWVKVEVTDQGEGIPEDLQKRLFTKFSQLEPSLSRSQEGTGLGLYICKLIVDSLGGKIGVESELGKGSTFYFILPINKPSESPRKNKITSF